MLQCHATFILCCRLLRGAYDRFWCVLQFENLKNLSEGDIAHFEASLTPVGDQTMVVEWFYKGEVLKASK